MKTKDIVHKSQKCSQNEHGICEGVIIETIDGSKITKICECQCHDSIYQLVRRMQISNSLPWVIVHDCDFFNNQVLCALLNLFWILPLNFDVTIETLIVWHKSSVITLTLVIVNGAWTFCDKACHSNKWIYTNGTNDYILNVSGAHKLNCGPIL